MNQRSSIQQWQQPWQPKSMPPNSQPQSHPSSAPPPRHPQPPSQRPNQSRGRSRQQEQAIAKTNNNDGKSHSNSNTPRRKGNPQSPQSRNTVQATSTSTSRVVDSLELAKSRSRSNSSARIIPTTDNVDLNTPLSALSTILTTTKNYHSCAIQSYRVNHKLFRDAKDRTAKAQQALAQAKAEYEHATTAQEYAHSELTASLTTKQQCENHTLQIEKQIRKLGNKLKGKRVKLVGLTQNVTWNGRSGTIVKLVVEGEDCGRWKVRLDRERRGGDPDGMDGRDSLNGEATRGDVDLGDYGHHAQCEEGNNNEENEDHLASHHVVAKAENLELLEDVDPIGLDGGVLVTPASIASTRSRSRSNKSRTSSRSRATSGVMSGKSRDPSTSRYSEDFQARSPHSSNRVRTPVSVTPDQKYASPRQKVRSPLSPPEIKSPKRNEKDLASAFSNMLLSPVSFEHVSFTAVPSDSFASPNNSAEQAGNVGNNNVVGYNRKSDSSIAGSFFDEVTPQEQPSHSLPNDQDTNRMAQNNQHHEMQYNHSFEGESHRGYPQEIYSTDLPTLVILPVQEDKENGAPNCICVQGAGVPHINGVYLLANDGSSDSGGPPSSPLYFKDAPPTRLEDDRYYDMCILRIDCPDSKDHVIWFLSRVDVDPSCQDVKFSDCYYYCRMLRDDNSANDCPPLTGWNIPKVPPGIVIAPSTSFSLESEGYHANELGEITQY